jgi:hypothetical protein
MTKKMYERLQLQSAEAKPTSDGLEMVVQPFVEGQPTATVPFDFDGPSDCP